MASRAEPSWKFSKPIRAELAAFEKRAEYELDFFSKPISINVTTFFFYLFLPFYFKEATIFDQKIAKNLKLLPQNTYVILIYVYE